MAEGQASGAAHGVNGSNEGLSRGIPEATIRAALERVLQSQGFRSSRRSQDFLRYVVERTLAGQADSLKERTIGVDVFGRSTKYEPSDDATVRVKAGEVRKRLELYYATEGQGEDLRIELPHGAYVPTFSRVEPRQAAAELRPALTVESSVSRPLWRRWAVPLACLILVVIAAAGWLEMRAPDTAVDRFWAPVLHGSAPLLLSAAYVPVYGVDPAMTPEHPTRFEDFVLLNDQFVGGGDLLAMLRISNWLDRMHHPYKVRIGSGVSFEDLRTTPSILIGYSYTRWRDISKELRFFIDADRRPRMVTDNGKPTDWALPNLPADRRTNEDYAIVTRVFHPDTQAMLVEVAGITQYGTEAGADLITNPQSLTEALRGAPPGWQNKNLQLVLHVKVISGTPAPPKVVKTYFW
jgi:hypothetical protein